MEERIIGGLRCTVPLADAQNKTAPIVSRGLKLSTGRVCRGRYEHLREAWSLMSESPSGSECVHVGRNKPVWVGHSCPTSLTLFSAPVAQRAWPDGRVDRYLGHLGQGTNSVHDTDWFPEPLRMHIDDLLRIAMERKASDLHLKVGNYPHLRIDGELVPLTDQPRVTAEDMLTMAFSMMSARQKQKFKETSEIDMAYGVAGLGRFRVNVFQQRGNV